MKVDISKLFDNPGMSIDFQESLDLGGLKRWGSAVLSAPVQVTGRAENRSGIVRLSLTADFVLQTVCDRCLTEITRKEQMEFLHIMVLSLNREDNDEFIVIPDGQFDLAELVGSDILLELPTSMLCGDGCKGLCPQCGGNLNEGDCGCARENRDSRFDVLRDLLQ